MVYEKQDKSITSELIKVASNSNNPLGQIQSLWTLNGLQTLTPELLITVFKNQKTSNKVREQILLLSEPLLKKNTQLQEIVTHIIPNSSPRYQFQQALTLGTIAENPIILEALTSIAVKNSKHHWIRDAITISLSQQPVPFLKQFSKSISGFEGNPVESSGHQQLLFEVSRLIGSRINSKEIEESLSLLPQISRSDIKISIFSGLAEGLAGRGKSIHKFVTDHPQTEAISKKTNEIFENSISVASDSNNSSACSS